MARRPATAPLGLIVFAAFCCGAAARPDAPRPYLAEAAEPDELAILPAPPAEHSAKAQAERDLFAATRALAGTPRWTLAIADADRAPAAVWADFSCALGAAAPAAEVPTLIGLLGRLNEDVEQATRVTKIHYGRRRPLVGNDLPLCLPRADTLAASFSFPSGHAMQGWATALVLAELAPDRSTPVLLRGRVLGDSRIVCGVHWPSDVEASRAAAAVLVSVLHGDAGFRRDLEAARAELAAARRRQAPPPDAAACRVEADAAAHPLAE